MRTRFPARSLIAVVAAAGLLLAGCGSDDPAPETSGASSDTSAAVSGADASNAANTPAGESGAADESGAAGETGESGAANESGGADESSPPAGSSGAAGSEAGAAGGEVSGTVIVFAAASLTKSFDAIAKEFTAANPGIDVQLSYDGSSTLVTQLQEGAPADVFASADEANMGKVADLVPDPVLFASNTLQIAVAPGNPKGITGLQDLGKDDVVTVLCAAEVPCGTAAGKALEAAGVDVTPASEEQNVTAVATKVASGEADAGLVYKTDVAASAGDLEGVDFPEAQAAVNTYPIGVSTDAANPDGAAAFVEFVTGDAGQKILADNGFVAP